MSADKQLAAYVDRVLRMKEEADGIAEDIKAIYGEAKAEGYDKTQLGNLVTYLRKRAKDKDGEAEKEAVFDLYLSAYLRAKGEVGTVHATRTHAPDDEITEPQVAPQPARDLTTSPPLSGQVAPIQPETATSFADAGAHGAEANAGHSAAIDSVPITTDGEANAGGGNVAGHDFADDKQTGCGPVEGRHGADRVALGSAVESSAPIPFTPKPLRPYCQHPERCGGQGRQHCYSCRVVAEQAGAA